MSTLMCGQLQAIRNNVKCQIFNQRQVSSPNISN
jgi:hypothetical protein